MTVTETIFATVIAALIVSVITFLAIQLRKERRLRCATIRVKLREELPSPYIQLIVRHIRDGKDQIDDKGKLINKDKKLKKTNNDMEWVVKLRYGKNLGFQFKCYVEFPEQQKQDVMTFLEKNGFQDIQPDETQLNRLWFILPNIPTCKTVDNYVNNYYQPNIDQIIYQA